MFKLNEDQTQMVINNALMQEKGLNKVLEMVLNGLMYSEREGFLETQPSQDKNKGNGFRSSRALGGGKELSLTIPRDRLGVFKPVVLALLQEQDGHRQELCFALCGKGLTTLQVGEIMEKI